MRRPLLVTSTTLALLLTSGGVVTAQDEVDEPAAGAFTSAGTLSLARTGHTATLLPDGRVLISGGDGLDPADLASAEVWDPSTSMFGPADALAEPIPGPIVEADIGRTGHTATLMPDGRALVIGGAETGGPIGAAEILDLGSETSDPAGVLSEHRSGHTSTFLRDGRVLIVGGTGSDGPLASSEVWTSLTKPAKCLGKRPTLIAQPGVELIGTSGSDVIAGSVGADFIRGGGGNDRICGSGGDDTIDGGGGNDTIDGGPGADRVSGAGGNDRLTGSGGHDTLNGGKGKDVCVGGQGTDWLPSCNESKATRGTVTVTKNTTLKGPHKGRFIIGRDGVTLDCDGHTITGAGRKVEGIHAITLLRRNGVTVRNCDIRDHFRGFWVERSNRNTFTNNRVSHVGDGFVLINSAKKNKLIGNRVADGDISGFALVSGANDNLVRDNVATGFGHGFSLWIIRGNTFTDNIARDNKLNGFHAGFAQGKGLIRNTFSGNSATDNGQWGFEDQSTGFRGDAGTDNHYEDNSCSGNGAGDSSPATLCD